MPHKDPEARKAYNKNRYHNGAGKAEHQVYQQRLKQEVFTAYGGPVCVYCGFDDIRALQLDHINGKGEQDRLSHSTSRTIYARLKRDGFPAGFQVLCANCNFIKRSTNNECTGPNGR
jgi:hypothetical protein